MNTIENEIADTKKKLMKLFFPNSKMIKRMIQLFTLFTVIGSIITVASSAYKADVYSDYYGIQVSNMDFLYSAKQMVVILGPLLMIVCIARFVIVYTLSCTDETHSIVYRCIGSALSSIALMVFTVIYVEPNNHFLDDTFSVGAVVCIVLVIGVFLTCLISALRKSKTLLYVLCGVVIVLVVVLCASAGIAALFRIQRDLRPSELHSYETVVIDDKEYVIVCGSDEKKLALECEIYEDRSQLILHYGRYRFICTDNYEYELMYFEYVVRDSDIPVGESIPWRTKA